MKNITISVDDNLYRQVRVYAALHDTTATELVRNFLLNLKTGPENTPGCRVQTIRDRIAAGKNALIMHKIRAYLGEDDGVGEKINTPPPLPPVTVKL